MKQMLASILFGLQPLVVAGLSDMNFVLGTPLGCTYFFCLVFFGFAYTYPGWDEVTK